MKNTFDLEQNILQCWNVCDDIELLLLQWEGLNEDQKQNYLIGLRQMYQMKFERCFETFENMLASNRS
jgi:hypothetical protein